MVTPKFSKSKKFCSICQSSNTTLPTIISLPTPKNGVEYTKLEALEVITHLKESDVITRKLELNYIPCGKSTFYHHYKDYKKWNPILNAEWNSGGIPHLFDDSSLTDMVKGMMDEKLKLAQNQARKNNNNMIYNEITSLSFLEKRVSKKRFSACRCRPPRNPYSYSCTDAMKSVRKTGCQGWANGLTTGCGKGHLPGRRKCDGNGWLVRPWWLKDTPKDWEGET